MRSDRLEVPTLSHSFKYSNDILDVEESQSAISVYAVSPATDI